MDKFIKK